MKCFSSPLFQRLLSRNLIKLMGGAWVLGIGISAALPVPPAVAAQRLVFTLGPIGRSIPIEDLRTLAETGEATRQIRWYLNLADLSPEALQQALNQEVNLSQRLVDRVTYSLPGEFILYQIGNTIRTRSDRANIQANRAALLLSTSEDNKISLLEYLENYPTPELYIDGVSLLKFVKDVERIKDRIEPIVATIETLLEGLICDCENTPAQTSQP
ncbi:MAG: alpha/beta hydrolase [Drouetiella hepatica Uher 2000/2452]|jgi:hypothetical protein|uniref:Alpha/beta hydrolase n=1 Tax=Drouetiella hepatica Uher 2000/2452 TaxID=904376 RepID=A0A951QCA0_9CYAN|nr:alpha/beta hydrolase [Drouetiella hepatica Uher 2000/2452]